MPLFIDPPALEHQSIDSWSPLQKNATVDQPQCEWVGQPPEIKNLGQSPAHLFMVIDDEPSGARAQLPVAL